MHDEPTTFSNEVEPQKKVEGPVTDDNFDDLFNGIPDVAPVFAHRNTRRRITDVRLVIRQVMSELKAAGFSPRELSQALIILAELLQVMQPIVKDLVNAIKKAFGKG